MEEQGEKKAVQNRNSDNLKKTMETYSKLDKMRLEEKCEIKNYFISMTMEEARTHFRIRSNTLSCKLNQSSDPKNIHSGPQPMEMFSMWKH